MKRQPLKILKSLLRIPDLAAAVALLFFGILIYIIAHIRPRRRKDDGAQRHLAVLDTAYSWDTIVRSGQQNFVLARDLGGYFHRVTTVHPLVGADSPAPGSNTGELKTFSPAKGHVVLENPVFFSRRISMFTYTNFVLSQYRLVIRLDRLIRGENVHILRIGDPHYQGILGVLLTSLNKIPLVIRIGGNMDAIFQQTGQLAYPRIIPTRSLEKKVERFVLKRADLVVGANVNNLQYAVANGADADKTAVFRYGNLVHPDHFLDPGHRDSSHEQLADLGLSEAAKILLYVGRLERVKHVEDLVHVAKSIAKTRTDFHIVLIGDGTLRPRIEQLSQDAGVAEHVKLAGSRDQQWIARILAMTDVILAPHMGRALVECGLGGAPIVAYDHDWQAEFVDDGVDGFLVEFGNTAKMAERALTLLNDPQLAKKMGTSIRQKALTMMDPERLTENERATYDKLLTRSRQSVSPATAVTT